MQVAIAVFQRNEGKLLEAWVQYHSQITAFTNLYVLDNQTDDLETLTILHNAESKGVHVLWGNKSFEAKGSQMSALLREVGPQYDWFVPLDCDEFLAVRREELLTGANTVLEELSKGQGSKLLRINNFAYNIPMTTLGYFADAKKLIVSGDFPCKLDTGYHGYDYLAKKELFDAKLVKNCDICYLHFHNRPFPNLIKSTMAKMADRLPSFDRKSVAAYRGDGYHLLRYFNMSYLDYNESFRSAECDFGQIFHDTGLSVPFSSGT